MNNDIRPIHVFNAPPVQPVARDQQRNQDGRFRKEFDELAQGEENAEEEAQKPPPHHLLDTDQTPPRESDDEPPGVGLNLDVRT